MTNEELVNAYPWLEARDEEGDGRYCLLDDLPTGWRTAYGEKFAAALGRAVELDGMKDTYEVAQVKEKFGDLCWYDNAGWRAREVKEYYEKLFARTCVECGEPAEWRVKGTLSPFCTKCKDRLARNGIKFIKFGE